MRYVSDKALGQNPGSTEEQASRRKERAVVVDQSADPGFVTEKGREKKNGGLWKCFQEGFWRADVWVSSMAMNPPPLPPEDQCFLLCFSAEIRFQTLPKPCFFGINHTKTLPENLSSHLFHPLLRFLFQSSQSSCSPNQFKRKLC